MQLVDSLEMNVNHFEEVYGELVEVEYDVKKQLATIQDSLQLIGIDTIVELYQAPDNNLTFSIYKNGKRKNGSSNLIPTSWVLPSYIIWRDEGNWYLQRTDEISRYNPHVCDAALANTFFNFVNKNAAAIAAGVMSLSYMEGENEINYNYQFDPASGFYPSSDKFSLNITYGENRIYLSESYQCYAIQPFEETNSEGVRVANSEKWFHIIENSKPFMALNLLHRMVSLEDQKAVATSVK
ncbi:MAG: hypothetical protein Crog4KO_05890 [Crocinitomicaceae bacterium]